MPLLHLLALLLILAAAPLHAAPSLAEQLASLEKELATAQAKPGADAAQLDKVRTRLETIQQELTRLQAAETRLKNARQLERQGGEELNQILSKLRAPPAAMPVLSGLSSERLMALLQQTLAEEQAARERLEAANRALSETEQRGQALRQSSLQAAQPPPAPAPSANEPPLLARVGQLLNQVRQQAQEAESRALALEQSTQPLAQQLAQARQLLAQRELEQVRERRERIEATLNSQRLAEAEAASQQAGQAAEGEHHPALKRLAEANQAWAERLTRMTQRLADLGRQRDDITRRTEAMRQDMAALRQRIEQLGLSPVIGNLLLQKRSELPSDSSLKRQIKDNRAIVSEIQLLDLDLANEQNALANPQQLITSLLADLPEAEQKALEPAIQRLLKARGELLQRLEGLEPPLLLAVNDVEFALETQRRVTHEFADFIAQNLLWMPNARPLWSTAWADYEKSLLALFDLRRAWEDVHQAVQTLASASWANLATLLVVGALLALRPRLRRYIRHAADLPLEQAGTSLWLTLAALSLVLLYALPWPLLAWLLGARLQSEAADGSFAQGLGQALTTLAPLLLYARAALALFHPKGLAERHFQWSPQVLAALRQAMHIFTLGVLPFGFLAALALGLDTEALRDGAGRLAFILALGGMAFMFGRLFHPKGALILSWRMHHARALGTRLAPLWFLLGTGLPLGFAALAAAGYFYSASLLTEKLITSLWLALGLWVFYDFGLRFLQLARQRIEGRREQDPAHHDAEFDGAPSAELDVEQISQQSRKLLNFSLGLALLFALYTVWSPILPALHVFEHITLWQYHGQIKGETVAVNVSLGDLLLAGLGLLAMWVAAKNLPGLMEIVLERWTGYDPGTRYAIITISRYLIIAVGLVLILGRLGLQWSQMQWLVAALGVGLGFGLQEIFANFISGLIILFERPVRVGDLVSIGDKTGHIKKIHIRATVLEDFDRKEIIIPNKKLITEQVTNWTLSDTSTRVVVDVGVAYGSNPREVAEVLRTAAGRVPGLIQDPPPGVWFMGFGDSALNFRLRAFVENAEARADTISELHYAIEHALREKGISIPFPQRDIHIKDIQGLPAGLFQENKAT